MKIKIPSNPFNSNIHQVIDHLKKIFIQNIDNTKIQKVLKILKNTKRIFHLRKNILMIINNIDIMMTKIINIIKIKNTFKNHLIKNICYTMKILN